MDLPSRTFFPQHNYSTPVKHVIPQSLSPPGSGPWQPHHHQQHSTPGSVSQGPPSPASMSSGSTSPSAYSPSRTLDLSGSSTSFSSEFQRKAAAGPSHNWQNGPVHQWSKEQVRKCLFNITIRDSIFFFYLISGLSLADGTRPGPAHGQVRRVRCGGRGAVAIGLAGFQDPGRDR